MTIMGPLSIIFLYVTRLNVQDISERKKGRQGGGHNTADRITVQIFSWMGQWSLRLQPQTAKVARQSIKFGIST